MKKLAIAFLVVAVWSAVLSVGSYNLGRQNVPTEESSPAFMAAHAARSPSWAKVRRLRLEREPACAVCGTRDGLEVHHIIAFHERPDLELDDGADGTGKDGNLITLCRPHHLLLGHLDSWRSWNVHVREDAARLRERIRNRP